MACHDAETWRQILRDGRYSDLKITCQDQVFDVHRIAICPFITKIKDDCDAACMEDNTCHVGLMGIEPEALSRTIEYCYFKKLSVEGVPYLLSLEDPDAENVKHGHKSDKLTASPFGTQGFHSDGFAVPQNTHSFFDQSNNDNLSKLIIALENAIKTYICAKSLGAEKVVDVAAESAVASATALFKIPESTTSLTGRMGVLFEAVSDNTDKLRQSLIKLCIENYQKCKACASLSSLLEEHEPVAWQVCGPMFSAERDVVITLRQTRNCSGCSVPCSIDATATRKPFGQIVFDSDKPQPIASVQCSSCVAPKPPTTFGLFGQSPAQKTTPFGHALPSKAPQSLFS